MLVGVVLALLAGLALTWAGMDRDRAVYPVVMIVIASYYVLFAVLGNSPQSQLIESSIFVLFFGMAIAGFRSNLWLVVFALAMHGALDVVHGLLVDNPGVPVWWPGFCAAYDLVAAGYLGGLLASGRLRAGILPKVARRLPPIS